VLNANNTVTVNAPATTTAGVAKTIDLSQTQRIIVTDQATGKSVGAGFQAATSPTNLTFSASAVKGAELSLLQGTLPTGESVLSAWTFSTTGYTPGNPVYLSLFAGSGYNLTDLAIWEYNGSTWTDYSPFDLAYDGTYASFAATSLNDFAVTDPAPTPIPGALLLFGPGLAGLALIRRRALRRGQGRDGNI
jgi:hypothetical protein